MWLQTLVFCYGFAGIEVGAHDSKPLFYQGYRKKLKNLYGSKSTHLAGGGGGGGGGGGDNEKIKNPSSEEES